MSPLARRCVLAGLATGAAVVSVTLQAASQTKALAGAADASSLRAVIDQYCVTCHNSTVKRASLSFEELDLQRVGADADVWERVVRKLKGGAMPPLGARRPDAATSERLIAGLEGMLDHVAQQ